MIAVFLIGAGLLLLLYGYRYARTWPRALTVRVSFSRPHIFQGEQCELTEEIENRKRQAVPLTEIGFRLPRGVAFVDAENIQKSDYVYKRDLFAVEGMERIVRRYRVEGIKRGYYCPDQLSIHAPSLLFRGDYILDEPDVGSLSGMYVYARQVDLRPVLRVLDSLLGERESARRLYEDPFVFSSIRQYTPQDPMKAVNWKATARTGELMVNTFASVTSLDLSIFLDVSMDENIPFSEDLRELALCAAASLARNLASRQEAVKFYVNIAAKDRGYTSFTIGRSADALTQLEEFLASDFEKMNKITFSDLIEKSSEESRGRQTDRVCVFFSAFDTQALRNSMLALLSGQQSGLFVTAVRSAQGRRMEQQENLYILPYADAPRSASPGSFAGADSVPPA